MDVYAALFEIAKLLLSEDEEKTAEILLRRVLEHTGAERGFIVVREDGKYTERSQVHFDRGARSKEERRCSRGLIRQAIESGEILYSPNLQQDPRFAALESVQSLGECAVLVAPLRHGGERYGAVYLDRRGGLEVFTPEIRKFLAEFAEVAGLFIRRALERQALRERNRSLERDLFARHDFTGIVTRDPRMLELLKVVAQVADSEAGVLVRGETGTGKELVARALYVNGPRRKKPFVTLHCTAIPGTILESELFGHVRGAFTGATQDRAGRIAVAQGGTLFLDEVGEIPVELQAKLLRFLQFGEIQRLGSDHTERLDVRILSATHQDLGALVKAGRFRQDLYFRLKVVELHVPPLRERPSDIPLLLEHFLRKSWRRPTETPLWSPQALDALLAYAYPGNVRELEHLVERVCLLATGPELSAALLPPEVLPLRPSAGSPEFTALSNAELKRCRDAAGEEVERRFVDALMRHHEGNVSRAARESGLNRTYLQRLLARQAARGPGGGG
jgi:transcriptional regulator with GAF, ATPase, and Fis domain